MTSAGWNLLIYAIAANDDEHRRILSHLDAMRAALATEQCNLVVQISAASGTQRHWISWTPAGVLDRVEDIATGDRPIQALMTGLLDAGNAHAPDAATAFVLWAHGSGLGHMRRPRLPDHRPPEPVDDLFLTHVIVEQAIRDSHKHAVELLALNACWMATLEVAFGMRSVAEVQVGSQVYAQAWPYGAIVAAISKTVPASAEQLARVIVSAVQAEIDHGQRHDAVSAVRSAALAEVVTELDGYAARVTTLIDTRWSDVRAAVASDAQRLDDPYQVDFASLIGVLGKADKQAQKAAGSVTSRLRKAMIASAAHASHPGIHGLSILCPRSTHVDLDDVYDQTGFAKHGWATFLRAFQHKAVRERADAAGGAPRASTSA
ncbi:MAG: clostripain-related cysteine peptidase [Kofleriaceae bacterium]